MDSQWLKTQFELNPSKSKAGLAKILGLEPPAISKILNNARQIKAQEYMAMREFFGLPNDGASSLKKNAAYTLRPLQQNLLHEEQDAVADEWVIPAGILSARTQAPPDKIKIFQVKENAMEPDFRQGEHVLVDLSDKNPSPPGVFIVSDGFGHMIRKCAFVPKTEPAEVHISAQSDGFHSQTLLLKDFAIVGRVIAKLLMV